MQEKLLCNAFILSDLACPVVIGFACGLQPCSPPNLIAPLSSQCWSGDESNGDENLMVLKFFTFLLIWIINSVIWKSIFGAGCTFTIHLLVGCKSLCLALKQSQFDVRIYRKIQLLSNLFNEAYVGILFVMLTGTSMVFTSMVYVLFRISVSSAEVPSLVLIWTLIEAIDCAVIILYIFGLAGTVSSLSKKVLDDTRADCQWKMVGISKRKELNACSPIKISFGISNYIEKPTPLKFLEFSINRFVDLVLID